MGISYSVRPLEIEIIDAYRRLFPIDGKDNLAAHLSWRFEQCPHGRGLFAIAQDGAAGGEIVGMIGLIATRLRIGVETVLAYQAVDTVVDPAYRGRGVFVGLGKAAQDNTAHQGEILWGFPNANAAPGWFGKLGWQNFGSVPFLFRPMRTGYFLRRLAPFLGGIDLPLVRKRRASEQYRLIESFGEEFDALWSKSRSRDAIAVERNAAWLSWRLLAKPDTEYRSSACYDAAGAVEAFVSTRLVDKHGGRVCYVMEAMSAEDQLPKLTGLLREQIGVAADQGAEVALAWCLPGAWNRDAYRRAGFLPLPNAMRLAQIYFGARPLVPNVAPCVERGSNWFISYTDSDTV